MIGSIIAAGLGAVGSIYGGYQAARQMRKYGKELKAEEEANNDWYDRRYNEDATQRADAQRILSMTEDAMRQRNQEAAGRNAVMGAGGEQAAAVKEQNARALADAAAQMQVNAEQRKDAIESKYLDRRDQLKGLLGQMRQGTAQSIAEATKGVGQAATGIANAFDKADMRNYSWGFQKGGESSGSGSGDADSDKK